MESAGGPAGGRDGDSTTTSADRFVPAGDQADGNPTEFCRKVTLDGRAVGGRSERTQLVARIRPLTPSGVWQRGRVPSSNTAWGGVPARPHRRRSASLAPATARTSRKKSSAAAFIAATKLGTARQRYCAISSRGSSAVAWVQHGGWVPNCGWQTEHHPLTSGLIWDQEAVCPRRRRRSCLALSWPAFLTGFPVRCASGERS